MIRLCQSLNFTHEVIQQFIPLKRGVNLIAHSSGSR